MDEPGPFLTNSLHRLPARVYLGAHWPSDVAGAYLAGGIWLIPMSKYESEVNSL